MFDQVKEWSKTNPSRDTSVVPIEIRLKSDTGGDTVDVVNGPAGLVFTPLDPPGPVSFYLWHTDPLYRGGTLTLRRTILRETLVQVAKLIENECKGHRWQRTKVLEQLAAQQTSAVSPQQDTHELDEALCFVLDFQKVILDDIHKKVLHFPKELRNWTKDMPVWTTGLGSRCLYHLPGEKHIKAGFGSWLTMQEADGWRIRWPVQDAKLEDLKKRGAELRVSPTVDKPKKEDWAIVVGRADTIAHLVKEFQ